MKFDNYQTKKNENNVPLPALKLELEFPEIYVKIFEISTRVWMQKPQIVKRQPQA